MYKYDEIVKYSDVDKKGNLPLHSLLEYFQNCINLHALDIGKDFESMQKKGKAWILIAWKIKINKPIKIYDEITVGTWSSGHDKLYGYRNYVALDKNGDKLAYADTKWVLINIESRMPERITEEDLTGYAYGEAIDMPPARKKLTLSDKKVRKDPVKVLKTYIDTNGHMNNTAYFRLAAEYVPENLDYDTVDAVYVNETTEGMTIIPYVHEEENGIGISFEGEDGTVFTKIKMYRQD